MTCVKIWLSSPSFVNWDKYDRRSYETKNMKKNNYLLQAAIMEFAWTPLNGKAAKPEKPINRKTHSNLKNLQLLLKYSRLCCLPELWYVYSFPNSGCVPILDVFRFLLRFDSGCLRFWMRFFVFCFYDATYRMKTWNWLFTRRLILCWKSPRPDSWEIYNNKI